MRYAAACELAQLKLNAYKEALASMGGACAELVGACLAADTFVDVTARPPRHSVIGDMRSANFATPLPNWPGIDVSGFRFDFSKVVEQARVAALAELAG